MDMVALEAKVPKTSIYVIKQIPEHEDNHCWYLEM